MKKNYSEKITETPYYIIRKGIYDNGKTDFMTITTDTSENEYLHITMAGYEECIAEKEVRIHTFNENTMHFIISGKGYFDGILIGPGDGFMVRRHNTAEYLPDAEDPWTYCWINFNGKAADNLFSMAGLNDSKCTFSIKDVTRIAGLIDGSLHFDYRNTDVGMHLNSVLLEIFACLIAEKPDRFAHDTTSVMENRVKTSIEFINKNYREKNCIEKLAKAENVSSRYLSRLFRQFSDRSPQAHLIMVRIEEAKHLLRTTALSVSNIAAAVGYDDVMQFSRIFKKHTGISPTAYREGTMDIIREYE